MLFLNHLISKPRLLRLVLQSVLLTSVGLITLGGLPARTRTSPPARRTTPSPPSVDLRDTAAIVAWLLSARNDGELLSRLQQLRFSQGWRGAMPGRQMTAEVLPPAPVQEALVGVLEALASGKGPARAPHQISCTGESPEGEALGLLARENLRARDAATSLALLAGLARSESTAAAVGFLADAKDDSRLLRIADVLSSGCSPCERNTINPITAQQYQEVTRCRFGLVAAVALSAPPERMRQLILTADEAECLGLPNLLSYSGAEARTPSPELVELLLALMPRHPDQADMWIYHMSRYPSETLAPHGHRILDLFLDTTRDTEARIFALQILTRLRVAAPSEELVRFFLSARHGLLPPAVLDHVERMALPVSTSEKAQMLRHLGPNQNADRINLLPEPPAPRQ